jgi:ABC-2 type transport system permease protein
MSARRRLRIAERARARFGAAWRATLLAVLRDKGVLLILLAAPVVYGFFYPWPYSTQAVTRVPVALVDQDNSSLSRQITRFAAADPHLQLVRVTANEHEARQLLWQGRIEGYALLPPDLRRRVLRGEPAVVPIEGNGAYTLLNKAVLTGFSQAVGTVSAGVEIRKLQAGGLGPAQAAAARSPLNLQAAALFNPTEGYGSYVVPAVALLILQQTLLMGAAMLVGGWAEASSCAPRPRPGWGAWPACRASAWPAARFISAGCSSCRTTRAAAIRLPPPCCCCCTCRPCARWAWSSAAWCATASAPCRCCCSRPCRCSFSRACHGRTRRCPRCCRRCAG